MNTLKDVIAQMRAIAGDPNGEWLTQAYCVPLINHVYTLQLNYLKNTCSPFEERVVELLNLPAGTTALSAWQKDPAKALYCLRDPYKDGIDWKPAGLPPNYYRPARRVPKLPDVNPAAPGDQLFWEWRSFTLFITPLNCAFDLRVRGDFRPPPLVENDDVIPIPDMDAVLAEETQACAWRERQNPGQLQEYKLVFTAGLDDLSSELVRSEQAVPLRVGRYNRRHLGR